MLKNINYNIMENITILSKSLYRYDTYIKDARECDSCRDLWVAFRKQREKELEILLKELKYYTDPSLTETLSLWNNPDIPQEGEKGCRTRRG